MRMVKEILHFGHDYVGSNLYFPGSCQFCTEQRRNVDSRLCNKRGSRVYHLLTNVSTPRCQDVSCMTLRLLDAILQSLTNHLNTIFLKQMDPYYFCKKYLTTMQSYIFWNWNPSNADQFEWSSYTMSQLRATVWYSLALAGSNFLRSSYDSFSGAIRNWWEKKRVNFWILAEGSENQQPNSSTGSCTVAVRLRVASLFSQYIWRQ